MIIVIYNDPTDQLIPVRFNTKKDAEKFIINLLNDHIEDNEIIMVTGNNLKVIEPKARKSVHFAEVPEKDMDVDVNTDDEDVSEEDISKLVETTVPLKKRK